MEEDIGRTISPEEVKDLVKKDMHILMVGLEVAVEYKKIRFTVWDVKWST